jgi:hypothetical protein
MQNAECKMKALELEGNAVAFVKALAARECRRMLNRRWTTRCDQTPPEVLCAGRHQRGASGDAEKLGIDSWAVLVLAW